LPAQPPTITLLLGPFAVVFTAPKLLLSYHSSYFDCAIYGSKDNPSTITLPDLEPREIEKFLTWLVTGRIHWGRLTGDPELESPWVLGHTLGSASFCNSVMYLIFTDCDSWSLERRDRELFLLTHEAGG
jgi:hypothetical protein